MSIFLDITITPIPMSTLNEQLVPTRMSSLGVDMAIRDVCHRKFSFMGLILFVPLGPSSPIVHVHSRPSLYQPPITSQHKNSPAPYYNSRDLDFKSARWT